MHRGNSMEMHLLCYSSGPLSKWSVSCRDHFYLFSFRLNGSKPPMQCPCSLSPRCSRSPHSYTVGKNSESCLELLISYFLHTGFLLCFFKSLGDWGSNFLLTSFGFVLTFWPYETEWDPGERGRIKMSMPIVA